MKKVTMMIAVLLAAFMVFGCTTNQTAAPAAEAEAPAAEQSAPAAAEQTAEKTITVAYAQGELVNAWRVCNQQEMKDSIEAQGWKFIKPTRTRTRTSSFPTLTACWRRSLTTSWSAPSSLPRLLRP